METESNITNDILTLLKNISHSDTISLSTRFNQMNIDSIAFVELIISIENKYDILFNDQKIILSAFKNISEFIKYIIYLKKGKV